MPKIKTPLNPLTTKQIKERIASLQLKIKERDHEAAHGIFDKLAEDFIQQTASLGPSSCPHSALSACMRG